MKFPWVSRYVFDALIDSMEREREYLRANREADRSRYDALLEKYTMLKLQGATEPPATITPPAPVERDLLKAAINAKFTGSRAALRRAALDQLARDRAANKSEEDILAAIEQGETANEGIPV